MSDLPPNNLSGELIDRFLKEIPQRPVTPLLGFGIFLLPIIFVWWLLQDGRSFRSRVLGFGWLALSVLWGLAN